MLEGIDGDDVIMGLGGNDLILGRSSRDTICGGDGNDKILAGGGRSYSSLTREHIEAAIAYATGLAASGAGRSGSAIRPPPT